MANLIVIWNILWAFEIFYGHMMIYFMAIWYIVRKNLATLNETGNPKVVALKLLSNALCSLQPG
jgi:hypothetical protein